MSFFYLKILRFATLKKIRQWVVFLLSSTSEPDPIKSEDIFLPPALPETKIHILKGRQGLEAWYVESPQISFSVSQENCTTYFWWENQGEHAQTYSEAFYLNPGFYIVQLNYYSENAYGKEPPKSIVLKVDTIAPSFILDQPNAFHSLSNQAQYTFKGKMIPSQLQLHETQTSIIDSSLSINQSPVSIRENGVFELDFLLSEGINEFLIQAYDEAGNHTEKQYFITLDTQAPLILINTPSASDTILHASVWIIGRTEPRASVMVDGAVIQVEEDGSFNHRHRFKEIGENILLIQASDPAGNINQVSLSLWSGTTIILTIGSLIYRVNQFQKHNDIEALIIKGRTMVPIRLLANELNAEIQVEYEQTSKKVAKVTYILDQIVIELFIDKTYAMVMRQKVSLDVAPTIIRQRTMVPLRFVAENLKAQVVWDAKTQEINIKYWKPEA
jgi:hypothetical protein